MKTLFLTALVFSNIGFAADSPVSAESFLSKTGELSFKIQNYSKDTSYDCVLSYDLRTYDEDHAYLRTAANIRTKVIYLDKNSSKRIKSDFELAEGEKLAELAHAVKAPDCTPAFKSRAVAIKDFYKFDNYVQRNTVGNIINGRRNVFLKVDFKDITQFEVSASKEIQVKSDGPSMYGLGVYPGFNMNPELTEYAGNGVMFYFLNERKQVINMDDSILFYNTSTKEIDSFKAPSGKQCFGALSSDYVFCAEGEEKYSFFGLNSKETIEIDTTIAEAVKDASIDSSNCQLSFESVILVEKNKLSLINRCIKKDNSLGRFDVVMERNVEEEETKLKFSSYDTVAESSLRLVDIRKDFPWALFQTFPARPNISNLGPKESLYDAAKRLFKRNDLMVNAIINSGKEEFFDIYLTDMMGNGFYGRIYWSDLK